MLIVDSHNHLLGAEDLDVLCAAAKRVPLAGFTVLALPSSVQAGSLELAYLAKRRAPDLAFIRGAWDHTALPCRPMPVTAATV
jgi:hypothetical protein